MGWTQSLQQVWSGVHAVTPAGVVWGACCHPSRCFAYCAEAPAKACMQSKQLASCLPDMGMSEVTPHWGKVFIGGWNVAAQAKYEMSGMARSSGGLLCLCPFDQPVILYAAHAPRSLNTCAACVLHSASTIWCLVCLWWCVGNVGWREMGGGRHVPTRACMRYLGPAGRSAPPRR